MNNKKKRTLVLALTCLGGLGILAGQGSTASALVCDTPFVQAGNPALFPVTQRATIACSDNSAGVAASMESVGTANDAGVKAKLLSGSSGVTTGYNSARAVIAGCAAADFVVDGTTVTDGAGCSGVRFKDIFVTD